MKQLEMHFIVQVFRCTCTSKTVNRVMPQRNAPPPEMQLQRWSSASVKRLVVALRLHTTFQRRKLIINHLKMWFMESNFKLVFGGVKSVAECLYVGK